MKKVFLATAFSGQVDGSGLVSAEFRAGIEQLLASLRKEDGAAVYCAMEHAGWKLNNELPEIGVQKALAEIDAADTLLTLMDEKPSVGMQFEIGYAIAKAKQVIVAVQSGNQLAYFNQGVVSSGLVTLITYKTLADLNTQLPVAVHAPTG